jgi:3D (Asp-Asp-Asp) domain-containing protein
VDNWHNGHREFSMTAVNPSYYHYGRFFWRCLPVVLLPLALLLLVRPLASHRPLPCALPDYTVWLHRTDIVYKGIPPLRLPPVKLGEISPTGGPVKTRVMRVTAYCPCTECCGPGAAGITASGHRIRPGDAFAAADPELTFGTSIIVPGYNSGRPVKVLDRGSAIKGDRLDVFFASHHEAVSWGVRHLAIILETPDAPLIARP